MIRRFEFEREIYTSLSCLPMAARRKLDLLGIKLSREQWQHLGRGARLMICHAPAQSDEERQALSLFIDEATLAACGVVPARLSAQVRRDAAAPASPPRRLVERARENGVVLDQAAWERLDGDARYVLIKLGAGTEPSRNLKAALAELLGSAAARPSSRPPA